MSAVWEAHLRMMSTLPIRTHEQRPFVDTREAGRPNPEATAARREYIRKLVSQHASVNRMSELVGINKSSVRKHIKAIKRGK